MCQENSKHSSSISECSRISADEMMLIWKSCVEGTNVPQLNRIILVFGEILIISLSNLMKDLILGKIKSAYTWLSYLKKVLNLQL